MQNEFLENGKTTLSVRAATIDDAELLWKWANDPSVREQSFNSEPISWESHIKWLSARMQSPQTKFYLLFENDEPAGQIRYDRLENEESAEISFSIAKEHRGKRLGIAILELTCEKAVNELNCRQITALVIEGNEASHKAFLRAGFEEAGVTTRNGKTSYKFVWKPTEN